MVSSPSLTLRASAILIAAAVVSIAVPASGDEMQFGGHVAYGLGGAFASEDIGSGFRQNLDASILVGSFHVQHSSIGLWGSRSGWMVGPMVATGFGNYPTYVGAEGGFGADVGLAGGAGLLGAIARVDPESGGGATFRLTGDMMLLELGVRGVAIFLGDPEFQLTALVGLGRF